MRALSLVLGTLCVSGGLAIAPSPALLATRERPGADSARVAAILAALARTDPVICDLIGDQLGNFWMGDESHVGRLSDAPAGLQGAKDSLTGSITDPRALALLINTLGSSDPCVRRVAAKLLGNSAASADQLRPLFASASPRIRESVAYAAGVGERRELRLPLERLVADTVPGPAAMATWALGEMQDPASQPVLVAALHATNPRVRIAGVWALGQLQDAGVASEVVPLLRDPDPQMRATAARALGEMKGPRVGSALIGALTDRAAPVRLAAARALSELEDGAAVATFEQLVLHDGDAEVRRAAADGLGKLSAARSLDALTRALGDDDADVRRQAAEAIGDLHGVTKAPEALVRAAASGDLELRRRATRTLGKIGDAATVPVLVERLSDADREVRLAAVEGLGELENPAAVPGLTRALNDRDPEVRRAAAEALGKSRQ